MVCKKEERKGKKTTQAQLQKEYRRETDLKFVGGKGIESKEVSSLTV